MTPEEFDSVTVGQTLYVRPYDKNEPPSWPVVRKTAATLWINFGDKHKWTNRYTRDEAGVLFLTREAALVDESQRLERLAFYADEDARFKRECAAHYREMAARP